MKRGQPTNILLNPDKFRLKEDLPLFYFDRGTKFQVNPYDQSKCNVMYADSKGYNDDFFFPTSWVKQRSDLFTKIEE